MYKDYSEVLEFIKDNELVRKEFENHFGGRISGCYDLESLFDGRTIDSRKQYEEFEKDIYDQANEINGKLNSDDYDIYEWIDNDTLGDIDFSVNSNGELLGAEVLIGYGGPNVYLDTQTATLKGRWGGMKVDAPVSYDFCDRIMDYCEEELQYIMESALNKSRGI